MVSIVQSLLCLFAVVICCSSRSLDYESGLQAARDLEEDLDAVLDNMEQGPDTSEIKTASKRALSVLSRWRPFGSIGLRTNSLNKMPPRAPMMSMVPELDFVSAETRGIIRPIGQPLRWGRKR